VTWKVENEIEFRKNSIPRLFIDFKRCLKKLTKKVKSLNGLKIVFRIVL